MEYSLAGRPRSEIRAGLNSRLIASFVVFYQIGVMVQPKSCTYSMIVKILTKAAVRSPISGAPSTQFPCLRLDFHYLDLGPYGTGLVVISSICRLSIV
jgi:hypothetical protein